MSTLTVSQRERIERNKLAALERRRLYLLRTSTNFMTNKQISNTSKAPSHSDIDEPPCKPNQARISKPQQCQNKTNKDNNNNNKHNSNLITKYLSSSSTTSSSSSSKQEQPHSHSTAPAATSSKSSNHKKRKQRHQKHESKPKTTMKTKGKHNDNGNMYKHNNSKRSSTRINSGAWTPLCKNTLFHRLAHSKFRSKFKLNRFCVYAENLRLQSCTNICEARMHKICRLGAKEIAIVQQKREQLEAHAFDFVNKRLSAAYPKNDGKQTPMRGHPVFIAQHATATCCRTCLSKWHYIPTGTPLTREQVVYMVEVLLHWIQLKCPLK